MLLAEVAVASEKDRRARFVCALYHIGVDGHETGVIAYYDGSLALGERGFAGFSYDPIFISPEHGQTFAEIADEEKDRVSHRARASRALLAALATGRK
jgi:XTP/dITP diphosphohydrolase